MNIKKKIYHHKNKLPLNKFHQLKRSKVNPEQQDPDTCKKIKKQIRDLERLIENGKLNEEGKKIKQEQLEEKKKLLSGKKVEYKQKIKKINYFARKYKKIKQVDLKKLKRQLIKIQKELPTTEDREGLLKTEAEIHEKINYIKHYPKDQKYISLFGSNMNDHAVEQQKDLLEKSQVKYKLMETKKYRMYEETQNKEEDDFLLDEEKEEIKNKTLVDKQGKEYQAEFNIPLLPSAQQENINSQGFYRLYPELTPLGAIKPHQAQAFNPEKTRLYIESLQKLNFELNTEVKQQAHDIVYLTQAVNKLIEENRSLAVLLNDKNHEMHSLVETVTINEAEEITDLKHQLRLLEDENFVLLKHSQELKDELMLKRQEHDQVERQFLNSKQYCQKLEQQIETYQIIEKNQSEEIQLLKERTKNEVEDKNKLLFEGDKKDSLIQSLNSHVEKLDKQLQSLSTDYERLEQDKNEQYSQSNLKIYGLNQQLDDLENELSKYEISNTQLLKEVNEYHTELAEKQVLCDRLADSCDDIMNKLQMEIERQQILIKNEQKLQQQIGELILQNTEYYTTIEQQTQQINQLIGQSDQDLSFQKQKFDSHMQKLKQDLQKELNEKQQEIDDLAERNAALNKELNETKNLCADLEAQAEMSRKEMHDYSQQKRIIEQLQLSNRQFKLQLEENKLLLQEFTSHKGGVQAEIEERDRKIQNIINQKDDRIAELERDFQMYYDQCSALQQHQKNSEHLEQLNYNYRQQKDLLEQEISRQQQDIDKLQNQVVQLQAAQKQQKIKADKVLNDENIQLRQQYNDLANELQKLKDAQFNTLPIQVKQPSEAGSRIKQTGPSQDFQQTKPNQAYLQPMQQQAASPHHSQHSPAYSKRNIQESDNESIKGGGNTQEKKMQFSFADEQLKLQQQQNLQRKKERENSYHSSMSNAPYKKKP